MKHTADTVRLKFQRRSSCSGCLASLSLVTDSRLRLLYSSRCVARRHLNSSTFVQTKMRLLIFRSLKPHKNVTVLSLPWHLVAPFLPINLFFLFYFILNPFSLITTACLPPVCCHISKSWSAAILLKLTLTHPFHPLLSDTVRSRNLLLDSSSCFSLISGEGKRCVIKSERAWERFTTSGCFSASRGWFKVSVTSQQFITAPFLPPAHLAGFFCLSFWSYPVTWCICFHLQSVKWAFYGFSLNSTNWHSDTTLIIQYIYPAVLRVHY